MNLFLIYFALVTFLVVILIFFIILRKNMSISLCNLVVEKINRYLLDFRFTYPEGSVKKNREELHRLIKWLKSIRFTRIEILIIWSEFDYSKGKFVYFDKKNIVINFNEIKYLEATRKYRDNYCFTDDDDFKFMGREYFDEYERLKIVTHDMSKEEIWTILPGQFFTDPDNDFRIDSIQIIP